MTQPPWFPDYYVEISDTGPGAFQQNATDVRLTFRVPNEQLDEVLKTLLPNEALAQRFRELTNGW
ncbi:hypothetical protein SEA_SMEADLEY_39 [Mycobacterium phage Smeadley]|uniref:Uncharacterized protein n=1 Tax=Mycobacterium phage Smeadley TaxID=1673873 RepID=A0A0H4TJQ6_9CAUD|nr:hypothetical protein AVT31_gp068 [Mycobacterium phage Smeadley]AKQ07607.1 hypothetical protein SEA_SMEADLEY_39 [Mycobacterium phage Smeadley]QBI96633.1 hypothetical protein SEA_EXPELLIARMUS_38 [Mycobacterium phage Expelliarmus]